MWKGCNKALTINLIKPFSARELVARVAAHLEMARIRQEATEQIRESEEKFRLLVETVKDYAIFMLDTEGRRGELECRSRAY